MLVYEWGDAIAAHKQAGRLLRKAEALHDMEHGRDHRVAADVLRSAQGVRP